jgi:HSP20 family protein
MLEGGWFMCAEMWKMRRDPQPFRPVKELDEMRRRFDEDVLRPVMHAVWEHMPEQMKSWSPPVEVFERADNLMVRVELPGMKQDDINVFATEKVLTIKGERKPESDVKDEDYFRSEFIYGSFSRSIDLPFAVDPGNIEAVYEDGILDITLERTAGSKPARVNVQVKKGTI